MNDPVVDVYDDGTVRLGPTVVCDGYANPLHTPFRVQTHIHDDHMAQFNRSKGQQDILMSEATRALLIAERNADLEHRDNVVGLEPGDERELGDGTTITLMPSGHMLGACQAIVVLRDGTRCGYSGDFSWPLENVIEVDYLVVDSTYGSPTSIRRYTQGEAEACLLEIVCRCLRYGSVHVMAHRGTIERTLRVLGGGIDVPIVASERLIREIEVYREYGFAASDVIAVDSQEGRAAVKKRSYVRLYSKGDGYKNELIEGSTIVCSAYMVPPDRPMVRYSRRAYRVALSNHADFEGTLAFVRATGARYVVTDNTRNYGVDLAREIRGRIDGVVARPSTNARQR